MTKEQKLVIQMTSVTCNPAEVAARMRQNDIQRARKLLATAMGHMEAFKYMEAVVTKKIQDDGSR